MIPADEHVLPMSAAGAGPLALAAAAFILLLAVEARCDGRRGVPISDIACRRALHYGCCAE